MIDRFSNTVVMQSVSVMYQQRIGLTLSYPLSK